MKSMIAMLGLTTSCLLNASQGYSTSQTKEVILKQCYVFPEVKLNDMERINYQANSPGEIRYHLFFTERTTSLILFSFPEEGKIAEKKVTAETNKSQSFQISEAEGNEADLLEKVQRFINERLIHKCRD